MKNVKQRSVLSNKRATCSFPLEWVANMIKKVRENKKKSEWEICKFDFKLPNGDAVTRKETVHLRKKKSQYELRASVLQGLGLTSLCTALIKC